MNRLLRRDAAAWLVLLLGLAFTAFVRIRLLDLPLERDEGEYAYAGQLLLQGVAPYGEACNMKLPGTYAAYAAILAVLPDTPAGIHIGLLAVAIASALLLFTFARRFLGPLAAASAAASFALLSSSPTVLGLHAHATHFVVLFVLLGLVLLPPAIEGASARRLLASGVCFGTAILMKQHAAILLPAAGLLVWVRVPIGGVSRNVRRGLWVLLGATIPLALTCAALAAAGVFASFWFWTIEYAGRYTTLTTWTMGRALLKAQATALFAAAPFVWSLGALGALALLVERDLRRHALFLLGFLALAFLSVCPGLYFREHYFVTLLPAVGLLVGAAIEGGERALARFVPARFAHALAALILVAAAGDAVLRERSYFFELTPVQACRKVYGANPFPESLEIGRYLREHSNPTDRVAIVGSEPQICFYAERRAASRFLYTYALVEPHEFAAKMREEWMSEFRAARPAFVVFAHVRTSWLGDDAALSTFLALVAPELGAHYERIAVFDIQTPEFTKVLWNEAAKGYEPLSPSHVILYRRRD